MRSLIPVARAAAAVAGLSLVGLLAGAEARTLWTLPVVTLVLLGLHHHSRWGIRGRIAYVVFLVGTAIAFCVPIAQAIASNIGVIPEWDYMGFWLHARTAVLGQNFYDPANAQMLASTYKAAPAFTSEFTREIIDTGFWYPPPSMFLFWPLGWLSPSTGLAAWYAFHGLIAGLVVVLLWKIFFPAGGAVEWIACATLVCMNYGTESTAFYAQTNFVALLALLVFWRRRDTLAGGAWAPVAFFVKPFLAAILMLPVFGWKRRALTGALLSAAALTLASALAFGRHTFFSYFASDPIRAKPDWIYNQVTNQSLLGLVLRVTRAECSGAGCVMNPIFLAGAAVFGAMTLVLGVRLQRAGEEEWALSLYLLLALIVYPVSQLFYSVLLIPPALLVWRARERVAGGAWTVSIVIATVYTLASLHEGEVTVFAYAFMWSVVALIGMRLLQRGGWPLSRAGEAAGISVPARPRPLPARRISP